MEIIALGVIVIMAACIWAAWGPKVLLGVLMVPPTLYAGFVAMLLYQDLKPRKVVYDDEATRTEECKAWDRWSKSKRDEAPWLEYKCNDWRPVKQ